MFEATLSRRAGSDSCEKDSREERGEKKLRSTSKRHIQSLGITCEGTSLMKTRGHEHRQK